MGNDSFNQEGNSSKKNSLGSIPSINCVCARALPWTHMLKQFTEIGESPVFDVIITANTGECLIAREAVIQYYHPYFIDAATEAQKDYRTIS